MNSLCASGVTCPSPTVCCDITQVDMVDNLTKAGTKSPQRVLDDLKRVKAMNLSTTTTGPLKILSTVHAAKVSDELPCIYTTSFVS